MPVHPIPSPVGIEERSVLLIFRFPEEFQDDEEHLEEKVFSKIENKKIRAILWDLPENQRQAVVLKYLEGLENAEIAEVLNKPVGAVKALQHRGLQAIRKKLKV